MCLMWFYFCREIHDLTFELLICRLDHMLWNYCLDDLNFCGEISLKYLKKVMVWLFNNTYRPEFHLLRTHKKALFFCGIKGILVWKSISLNQSIRRRKIFLILNCTYNVTSGKEYILFSMITLKTILNLIKNWTFNKTAISI